jgi:glycosyltransferase 2 family protein
MNKKVLSLIQYVFFLGLGMFLLWLTLRKSDWNTIISDLSGAKYIYLIPAILMLLVSHFIRALRWKILMEPLGYKPSSINTFLAVMVGYWANLAVPRLGEVLKCTILARYEKVPADKLVGTIVAERAIDVLSLIIIMLIAIFSQYSVIGHFSEEIFSRFFTSKTGTFSILKVLMVLLILFAFLILIAWTFKRLNHLPFVAKTKNVFKGIWQGLISIRYIKNKGLFILHSVLIWGLYLYSTYMGFFAMQDMLQYGLKGALSALTFGSFGMIIPSPGGIGSFQYAVQQVMMLYGVTPEKGLSLGMLIWFAQTGFVIVFGTIAFLLLPVVNKGKKISNEKYQ